MNRNPENNSADFLSFRIGMHDLLLSYNAEPELNGNDGHELKNKDTK